jgi:hypothetical protein
MPTRSPCAHGPIGDNRRARLTTSITVVAKACRHPRAIGRGWSLSQFLTRIDALDIHSRPLDNIEQGVPPIVTHGRPVMSKLKMIGLERSHSAP